MMIPQSKIPQWVHVATSLDGDDTEIQGVKIWKHDWEDVKGENAQIKDPHYGQSYYFGVYRVQEKEKVVEFAAGEFSNGVWGFYVRNKPIAPEEMTF